MVNPVHPEPLQENQRTIVPFAVTDACNAHCVFCAEHVPRMTPDLRDETVLTRLQTLLEREKPQAVLLGGGEPTLHPLLPRLIAQVRATGALALLHTNGMRLGDPRYLQKLLEADLNGVRIGIFGHDAPSAELATRLPRSFELTGNGILAALQAKLPVELEMPVHAVTQHSLLPLAELVVRQWPAVTAVRYVPYVSRLPLAPPDLHVLPTLVEQSLTRALQVLAAADISTRLASTEGFHPCAFRNPGRMTPLLSTESPRDTSGRMQVPACQTCALVDRCPGVERSFAAHLGDAAVTPFDPKRPLAWLPGGRRTRPDAQHIDLDVRAVTGTEMRTSREHVIRILHACNQRCAFCWVDFSGPEMSLPALHTRLKAWLQELPKDQLLSITLTGGEPTMHRDVVAMVALARELGVARIGLQTNATRLADGKLAGQLAAAGLDQALVALHHHDAEASDALTAARGTHARTLEGVRQLGQAGVAVTLNHVLTRQTAAEFPQFVQFLAQHFGDQPGLSLSVAVASHIGDGPLDPQVLPRMAELADPFRAGVLLAKKHQLQLDNLIHPCGVPPCVLDGDPRIYGDQQMGTGLGAEDAACMHADFCAQCRFRPVCPGIRKEYAQKFGTAEFHAIPPLPPVRVGLIGLGYMGSKYARAWTTLLGAEAITPLVRHPRDREKVQTLELPGTTVESLDLLSELQVTLATVATPTAHHAPIAQKLLNAGIHVLCEKPLAATLDEAEALAVHNNPLQPRCFVAHTTRAEPGVQTLHEALHRGRIGTLHEVTQRRAETRRHPGPHPLPEAMAQLYDALIHELSIFQEFLQEAILESARWVETGDAALSATLRTPTLVLHVQVELGMPEQLRTLTAQGSTGTLDLQVGNGSWRATLTKGGLVRPLAIPRREPTLAVVDEVLSAIQQQRPSFLDAHHGLRVMQLAGQIVEQVTPPPGVLPFAWPNQPPRMPLPT